MQSADLHGKTYLPVYLYHPKNSGNIKIVKDLIDFLMSTTA
ncbi:Hypothetical protein ABZS17H1_03509 [Kosakonia cowanii]